MPEHTGLLNRFHLVRQFTETLVETLSPEDCTVQSMPDVSPTRWHLAHTTWFFETFLLKDAPGYAVFDPQYEYLFNSYYNAVGRQFPRDRRGVISRPGIADIRRYRAHVDQSVAALLESAPLSSRQARILETGLNHEQQHQELILTDIKHVLSCNPAHPVYRAAVSPSRVPALPMESRWIDLEGGLVHVGHEGDAFCFDNERPRHRVHLPNFRIASHTVTNADFLSFITDGGYQNPALWLSLGWQAVQQNASTAPLYWHEFDGQWQQFTLGGVQTLVPDEPVCHVSYFEADAYARWSGRRLPTEFEWEHALTQTSHNQHPPDLGHCFADPLLNAGHVIHPRAPYETTPSPLQDALGNVWEWTSSQYNAYPGYRTEEGALGEYNGKFMCNQFVLRGGSCATPAAHIRGTYRNFFPPEARWQFTGLRLAH